MSSVRSGLFSALLEVELLIERNNHFPVTFRFEIFVLFCVFFFVANVSHLVTYECMHVVVVHATISTALLLMLVAC